MKVVAKYEVDRAYLEAHFRDWLQLAPWYRKWQLQISGALFLASVVVLKTTHSFVVSGGLMVVIGIIEFLQGIWLRRTWVSKRMKARAHLPHQSIELLFDAEGIEHSGPVSSGKIKWSGVSGFRETTNALILSLGDREVLYVPKTSVNPTSGISEIRTLASRGV